MSDFDEAFEQIAPKADPYLATPGLNWSTLKLMATSPLALRDTVDHGREDSESLLLGRAIHCYALERDEFRDRYAVAPDFGDGRTKAAKEAKAAFQADLGSRELITQKHWETIRGCGEALAAHKVARKLLEGKHEHIVTWTHAATGIACKGRLDVVGSRVVDLKTHSADSVRQIFADANKWLYHGQGAWYHDGACLAGLLSHSDELPANVWVQNKRPFDVVCAEMEEETYQAGLDLYERLLVQYQGCAESRWWPGMAPEMIRWTLPNWAKVREQ